MSYYFNDPVSLCEIKNLHLTAYYKEPLLVLDSQYLSHDL